MMIKTTAIALTLAAMSLSAPALAAVSVTDPIDNPAGQWAGIDYWGVQVGKTPSFDQTLTFSLTDYSKVDLYMGGSPKFLFTDILLNGISIVNNISIGYQNALVGSGYADAGQVSLQFKGDYSCADCYGDWFGGFVQVSAAPRPAEVSGPIPEPSTWALLIGGFALVGVMLRRRAMRHSFG